MGDAPDLRDVQRAVIPFVWGLGDHILALPALRALGRLLPGRLTLLSTFSAPDLFFGDVGFARIVQVEMDFHRADGSLFDLVTAAAVLGQQDLLIVIADSYPSEWDALSRLLQCKWSVGLSEFCSYRIDVEALGHTVDRAFAVPKLFRSDLEPEDFAYPFPLPAASVEFAESIRSHLQGRKLLVIHGETKPNKRWSVARFRETINIFLQKHRNYMAVEIARSHSIFGDDVPDNIVPIIGLPLASGIALTASADILLCVDSLFLHVADLWRTPSVAIFGRTAPARWGFRFNTLFRHACAADMADLEVKSVLHDLCTLAQQVDTENYRPIPLSPTASYDLVRWT